MLHRGCAPLDPDSLESTHVAETSLMSLGQLRQAMLPIGVTEGELKRRVFAVTVDRPNTARAQEPHLPPAKGKGAKGRRGKECVLTGAKLNKLNAYTATHQMIMLHFLWHGMSLGYEKLDNRAAASKAFDEELRIG
jgi:hypothetical protein